MDKKISILDNENPTRSELQKAANSIFNTNYANLNEVSIVVAHLDSSDSRIRQNTRLAFKSLVETIAKVKEQTDILLNEVAIAERIIRECYKINPDIADEETIAMLKK